MLVSTVASPLGCVLAWNSPSRADRRLPMVMRFQPGDFADIASATAAEVAGVLNRTLADDGHALGRTPAPAAFTSRRARFHPWVEQDSGQPGDLRGRAAGRLSAFIDATARIRLFYETADPLAAGTEQVAAHTVSSAPLSTGRFPAGAAPPAGSVIDASPVCTPTATGPPTGNIRNGAESHPLMGLPNVAQGDPAAVELPPLPDGSRPIWLAWIDNPHTNAARLRFARGTARTRSRHGLQGSAANRSGLFRDTPPLSRQLAGSRGLRVYRNGFPRPATCHGGASRGGAERPPDARHCPAQPNRTLLLSTVGVGGDERLEIDIRHSSAASALGFNAGNAAAFGDWGDGIDWENPQDVTAAPAGRHADLHAVVAADGVVALLGAWSDRTGTS